MSTLNSQANTTNRRARRHARRWIPYAGALMLAAVIAGGLWPRPIPVELARASVGALRATVNEEGRTRIKERYVVSAPVTGQLRRIHYKAGAEVKAGETVLAVIDPVLPTPLDPRTRATSEAKRDAAAANLEKARATRAFAKNELTRFEKLYAEKAVSVQELEAAQLRDAAAAKEESAAEGALRQAEAELGEFTRLENPATSQCPPTEVKATVNGRVLRVFEESTRVVTAGTPLVEVGDPTNLEVVVEVLSRDGASIRPGAQVEFEQWGSGAPLRGRVRLVEPAAFTKVSALGVEEQRVNVIADLLTPPEQRPSLGDKFRVEARIVTWENSEALKVPAGALFRRGENWAVFVITEGKANLRAVQVGKSSGTETEILEGLKKGEQVILYPGTRVKEGNTVREIQI